MMLILDDDDDDDDDYVGVGIFGIGGGVELPTGDDLLLSDRGHWLCWRRPLCSDAVDFVIVVVVIVISRPLLSSRICVGALSLEHDGECWRLAVAAIVWCRCIVGSMSKLPSG